MLSLLRLRYAFTRLWHAIRSNLNFFRIHLLAFTITPLIFSGIFFAANGEFHIAYVDSLFLCVSAMTVTGLATVDLSSLTGVQQAVLFVLQCLGSPVLVSWLMVYIRRRYFILKFEHIVQAELEKRRAVVEEGGLAGNLGRRLSRIVTRGRSLSIVNENTRSTSGSKRRRFGFAGKPRLPKFNARMVRRLDDAPKPIDPSGFVSHEAPSSGNSSQPTPALTPILSPRAGTPNSSKDMRSSSGIIDERRNSGDMRSSPERFSAVEESAVVHGNGSGVYARSGTLEPQPHRGFPMGNTLTVEFKTPEHDNQYRHARRQSSAHNSFRTRSEVGSRRYSTVGFEGLQHRGGDASSRRMSVTGDRYMDDNRSNRHQGHRQRTNLNSDYGGFPGPVQLLLRLFKILFPGLERRLVRTVTLPRTQTLQSAGVGAMGGDVKLQRYLTFDAIVGRNSKFHLLTDENLQELGGVEFRALTALLWIVGGYHIGSQLIAFTIIAPYISTGRWRSIFKVPNLHRYVSPVWFAAFQVTSAYTNSGMSLVDQSMVPFQKAYPMILSMVFLILAGNTAFPVFLRLFIWIITKLIPNRSRLNDTLHFLLDHPRRCFIYLFPSHQTWFLFTVLLVLNGTDWFFFLVLDIGNPALESIPIGTRICIGLLQASAVRAAGFGSVALSALAPAVQVLYVMMMYISVYPIAMSVRSTNVYEEKSLGVFDDENSSSDSLSAEPSAEGDRVAIWGRYLAWHARKQLAFDMWWIGLALFLVCIIEKNELLKTENFSWLTIFSIVFELISAYGTVGLSLGVPYASYSLSGAFSPLSKLIVCCVMLRGRHRGLPVAIDRAVLLPSEYAKDKRADDGNDDFPDLTPAGANAGPNDTTYPDEKQDTNGTSNEEGDLRQRRTKF
ncbi:TrkH-domain-containing protein [Schizopora paradoxa]|uniref:Potassium transport protein n=1 Tax=Schizopora paradoxa TaxID=27342 RepID=A0A0H2RNX2_9AGAM|nr:TrkH-domain-containing protein [Schizopora paradoxa]